MNQGARGCWHHTPMLYLVCHGYCAPVLSAISLAVVLLSLTRPTQLILPFFCCHTPSTRFIAWASYLSNSSSLSTSPSHNNFPNNNKKICVKYTVHYVCTTCVLRCKYNSSILLGYTFFVAAATSILLHSPCPICYYFPSSAASFISNVA